MTPTDGAIPETLPVRHPGLVHPQRSPDFAHGWIDACSTNDDPHDWGSDAAKNDAPHAGGLYSHVYQFSSGTRAVLAHQ